MNKKEIGQGLMKFFETEFPNPGIKLTGTTNLLEDWFIDSISIIQTAVFLEREFGVKVERSDIIAENFLNVDTLTAYVARRRRGA